MKRLSIILLMAGFLLPLASAAQRVEYVDSLGQRYVIRPIGHARSYTPEHEFRIGIGAYPLLRDRFWDGDGCMGDPYDMSLGGRIEQNNHYLGPEFTTGAITAMYTYRAARMLELGVAFDFMQYYRRRYHVADNLVRDCSRNTYYSFTPQLRFSWFNRPLVRMYSGFSVGLRWLNSRDFDGYKHTEVGFSGQFTALGISVGRQIFGYAEFGFGIRGVLSAGVGYRFNNAKK